MPKVKKVGLILALLGDVEALARAEGAVWFLLCFVAGFALVLTTLTTAAVFKRDARAFRRIVRLIQALKA